MERKRLVVMLEIAIMAAVAIVLGQVKFGALWAMGGSISLVMVPIFIMMYRRGWKAGVITGLLVGILDLLIGGYVVHPVQLVLDYPLAYAVLGLGGLFVAKGNYGNGITITSAIIGTAIGSCLRLLSHFASGVIWFGEWTPEGIPVVLYSIIYNGSYLVPEMIITVVVIMLISKYYPQFFIEEKSYRNRI
jgi:thiamine transporter